MEANVEFPAPEMDALIKPAGVDPAFNIVSGLRDQYPPTAVFNEAFCFSTPWVTNDSFFESSGL